MKLNLLVADDPSATDYEQCHGKKWSLATYELGGEQQPNEVPEYSCVSYTWGAGRRAHSFHKNAMISDRTLDALAAVTRQRPQCKAIWLDALCVPPIEEREWHATTLESMGYIYSQAQETIVVLSSATAPALVWMNAGNDTVLPEHLDMLEKEEWTCRAWTYQEATNSRALRFICEHYSDALVVEFNTFFDRVSGTLSRLQQPHVKRYPRLNELENLLADCAVAGYQGRSAFQAMSVMENRTQTREDDHFYAMIGAITAEPASSAAGGATACEAFISLCERKGDYSFIYSATPRDDSRRWRPVSHGSLPVVFAWSSWGPGQPGYYKDGDLYLENMVLSRKGLPAESSREYIRQWFAACEHHVAASPVPMEDVIANILSGMGFSGSRDPISVEHGFFFPYKSLDKENVPAVLISTDIRWVMGAPALAARMAGDELQEYVPGVFVGQVWEGVDKASVNVSSRSGPMA